MAEEKRSGPAGNSDETSVGGSAGHPEAHNRNQRARGDQVLANRRPQSSTRADEPQSAQQQVNPPAGLEDNPTD